MGLLTARKLRSGADLSSLRTIRGFGSLSSCPRCRQAPLSARLHPTEEGSAAIGWADRVVSIHAVVGGHGYRVLLLLILASQNLTWPGGKLE